MSTSPSSEPIPLSPVDDVDDIEVAEPVEEVELEEGVTRVEPSDTSLHWAMLLSAATVLVLSAILQVRGPETVVIPVVDVALPGTCTYKQFIGMECPGCGLTRCFISMAHGRPVAAWYFNPAGVLFFAIVAAQLPFRGIQIWRIRRGLAEFHLGRFPHYLLGFLIVALLTQWFIRTYFV
jgi:hypothetical protein